MVLYWPQKSISLYAKSYHFPGLIIITIAIIISPWLLTLGIVVVEALGPIGMKADVIEEGAIWEENKFKFNIQYLDLNS